jgi:hypothetical protein
MNSEKHIGLAIAHTSSTTATICPGCGFQPSSLSMADGMQTAHIVQIRTVALFHQLQ